MNISFIGFGNMAKAMVQGLVGDDNVKLIQAASPSLPIGTNAEGVKTHQDNLAILADADVIVLAVKPIQMGIIIQQINDALPPNCLLLSIAASISLPWFAKHSPKRPVVRAMPNLAAALNQSATPLIANEFVTLKQKNLATYIFDKLGLTTWTDNEEDLAIFTALSGSGPAYVFLFMDAMIQSAMSLGLTKELATSFTLKTIQGALCLATQTELNLNELRQKVTSPGGTTAAAMEVFSQQGFETIIAEAMRAAHHRAQQLKN